MIRDGLQESIRYPYGPIPASLNDLDLTDIDIELTGLTELRNLDFGKMTSLKHVIFMSNPGLGHILPDFSSLARLTSL